MSLCTQSAFHKSYTVDDVERCILPPLHLGQSKFLYHKGTAGEVVVIGFASWAFLTPIVAQGFVDGTRKLRRFDWSDGDELWLIDVIAPLGWVRWFCRRLRKHWAETYPEFPVVNYLRSHDRHKRRTLSSAVETADV